MKTIFLFLLFACSVFSMPDVSALNTFQDSAVITATPFNQNFDTLKTYINKNRDTLENKFIRFADLSSGDSTLLILKSDSQQTRTISATGTIITSGKISGDSLSIRAIDSHYTDSIEARQGIHAALFRGPLIGNVTGTADSSKVSGRLAGNAVADSIYSRAVTASGTIIGNLTGNVTGNVSGNLTGNVTGNASGTAATVTAAAQPAITSTGTLTSITVSGSGTVDSTYSRVIVSKKIITKGTTNTFTDIVRDTSFGNGGYLPIFTGTNGQVLIGELTVFGKSATYKIFHKYRVSVTLASPTTIIDTGTISKYTVGPDVVIIGGGGAQYTLGIQLNSSETTDIRAKLTYTIY